jgi:hypothetical protein
MFAPEQDIEPSVLACGIAAAEAGVVGDEDGLPSVLAFQEERIRSLYPTYLQKREPQTCFIPWPREPWSGRS